MNNTPPDKTNNYSPLKDLSLYFLIVTNLITAYFAVQESWSLITLMWVYLFQSIIIGFFNFIRILNLKKFSTDKFDINGVQPEANEATKNTTAYFFLMHYGAFHIFYTFFLTFINKFNTNNIFIFGEPDWKYVYYGTLLFFTNHAFSYFYNNNEEVPNIGKLLFKPYIRIIPMHLVTWIATLSSIFALPTFLLLKTLVDALSHIFQHKK